MHPLVLGIPFKQGWRVQSLSRLDEWGADAYITPEPSPAGGKRVFMNFRELLKSTLLPIRFQEVARGWPYTIVRVLLWETWRNYLPGFRCQRHLGVEQPRSISTFILPLFHIHWSQQSNGGDKFHLRMRTQQRQHCSLQGRDIARG